MVIKELWTNVECLITEPPPQKSKPEDPAAGVFGLQSRKSVKLEERAGWKALTLANMRRHLQKSDGLRLQTEPLMSVK